MKKKILFLIHDLGQGGAEKVLVNLVNHTDKSQFDISVISLFGGGVNEQYLNTDIRYSCIYKKMIPANSQWMKLFTPKQLHKKYIKDKYDIEVSFLEGPCARIISGCTDPDTKLVSWIHCTIKDIKELSASFRSYNEAAECYNRMDEIVFVSNDVRNHFLKQCSYKGNTSVHFNVMDSEKIINLSKENINNLNSNAFNLMAMGTLKQVKGFDRLFRIIKKLIDENYSIHLFLLGEGPMRNELESYIKANNLENSITMLGYQTNPYKYLSKCDLFVCSSYSEGLSTAATEALILGVPVCTTDVSGTKELLGDGEYGLITENSEEALYQGIKNFLDQKDKRDHYKKQAATKGEGFKTGLLVKEIEDMFHSI